MHEKNSHCSNCGNPFAADQPWPRTCARCDRTSYRNPVPVAVLLLPVDDGLLCIRRAIEPGKGKLALPGGFIDLNETWQEAAARELLEETGIRINPEEVKEFRVLSSRAGDGVLLILGVANKRSTRELPTFQRTNETSECVVIQGQEELAFPLHAEAVRDFFDRNNCG